MENKLIIKQHKGSDLIAELLYSALQAQVFHWQSKNGDVHRALGDYYSSIITLVDTIVESYQGKYGVIVKFNCDCKLINSRDTAAYISYFNSLVLKLEKNRHLFGVDSYIQNEVDGIVSLLYTTLYKLKELV